MLTYLSLGLGLVSLIAFMIKCNKQRSVGGVFIKNITSLFFLFTTATAIFYNQDFWKYGILILIGGVFGMLGDIYLDQKWVYPQHTIIILMQALFPSVSVTSSISVLSSFTWASA